MTQQTVTVDGADRLAATLARAATDLGDLTEPLTAAGDELQADARARAPRRTGQLAASFGTHVNKLELDLINTADHAPYVQFGTSKMSARPFMPDDPLTTTTTHVLDHIDDALSRVKGI